jgi:nucleoid-associated protein YgaU
MPRDFKTGIIAGLAVTIVLAAWLSTLPALSVTARLQNNQASSSAGSSQFLSFLYKGRDSRNQADISRPDAEKEQSAPLPNNLNLRIHIVQAGQTLSNIAYQYYGSAAQWTKILNANPRIDPNKIKPGTKLIIPK